MPELAMATPSVAGDSARWSLVQVESALEDLADEDMIVDGWSTVMSAPEGGGIISTKGWLGRGAKPPKGLRTGGV